MKKMIFAAVAVSVVFLPTAAGAVTGRDGAGAGYGAHVSTHARTEGGFSGSMNPGDHRGFAGFDEHEHH